MNTKMPALFLGHGSPVNAIKENSYTKFLKELALKIGRPHAVLCISAHWLTEELLITAMDCPRTIHDFSGFPQKLYQIKYPAPGDIKLAQYIAQKLSPLNCQLDTSWGLDHGAWSILLHLFPNAEIPVLQLSVPIKWPAKKHFEIGEYLRDLRNEGILILGSGNVVHNLRQIDWDEGAVVYPWANDFNDWVKQKIVEKNFRELIQNYNIFDIGKMSVPYPDHYFPLLTVLGAIKPQENIQILFDEFQNASISMLSVGGLN